MPAKTETKTKKPDLIASKIAVRGKTEFQFYAHSRQMHTTFVHNFGMEQQEQKKTHVREKSNRKKTVSIATLKIIFFHIKNQ